MSSTEEELRIEEKFRCAAALLLVGCALAFAANRIMRESPHIQSIICGPVVRKEAFSDRWKMTSECRAQISFGDRLEKNFEVLK